MAKSLDFHSEKNGLVFLPGRRHRDRAHITPDMHMTSRAEMGCSQSQEPETQSKSPICMARTQFLEPSHADSQGLYRQEVEMRPGQGIGPRHSDMGGGYLNQQLNH